MIYDPILLNNFLMEGQKERIEVEVLKIVQGLYSDIERLVLSFSGGVFAPLFEEIKNVIEDHFVNFDEELQEQLVELGLIETDFYNEYYSEIVETTQEKGSAVPLILTTAALTDMILKTQIVSGTYQTELKGMKNRLYKVTTKKAQYGLSKNRDKSDILSDIKKEVNKTINGLRGLQNTATSGILNKLNDQEMKKNKKFYDKLMFIAVLDNKTTKECRGYDGKTFNKDDQNIPVPPLHPNCRSSLIPKFLILTEEDKEEVRKLKEGESNTGYKKGDAPKYSIETQKNKLKNSILKEKEQIK